MQHQIFDAVPVDSSRVERLPHGGVRVPGRLARTGIQSYPPQHPITRELVRLGNVQDGAPARLYRDPAEVLSTGYLASLRSSPLTVGHPSGGVNGSNWRSLSVGHVEAATRTVAADNSLDGRGETFIEATAVVQDGAAAKRVLSKDLCELSCGYSFELDPTPGIANDGERYDAVIRSPRNNHVALLERGRARAGSEARILLDSEEHQMDQVDQLKQLLDERIPKPPAPEMVSKTEHEAALKQLTDAKDTEIKKRDEEITALKKAAEDRVLADAVAATKPFLAKDFVADGKSATELKRAAMGKEFDGADSEVDGAFRMFVKAREQQAQPPKYFSGDAKTQGNEQQVTDARERARLNMRKRNREAFENSYS